MSEAISPLSTVGEKVLLSSQKSEIDKFHIYSLLN